MFLFEEKMKHRTALLLACLVVAAAQIPTRAQPRAPLEEQNLFIGHYGEIFAYSDGWMAEASMRAETEFVRLQPKPARGEVATLADSAFRPENFTKKNLLELVVIPKDAPGGYRSLRDIRRAKEQDMSAHGIEYAIHDRESGDRQFDFPPGTFRVRIKRPYRLLQRYTESPKEFFILTYGDPEASVVNEAAISGNIGTVEQSLSKYLAGVNPPKRPEIDLRGFQGFWRMWLFFNGPLLLLILLPRSNSFLKRLNFIAYNLILFLNISGLIGFLIPCISYRTGWGTWQNGALLFATLAILGPWICRLIARRFYRPDEKRIFWWSWLAALPLVALDLEGYSSHALPDPVFEIIFSSTFAFAMTGMAFGLIFSLVATLPDRGKVKTTAPLLLMLLAFLVCPVHAREPSDSEILASTPAELARRMLREKKGDYDYRGEAVKKLKREGRYFDRQRVEITGLGSSDNTYDPKSRSGLEKSRSHHRPLT